MGKRPSWKNGGRRQGEWQSVPKAAERAIDRVNSQAPPAVLPKRQSETVQKDEAVDGHFLNYLRQKIKMKY
jgi:hypothetical protein